MISTLLPSGCCVRLIDLPVSVGAMVAFDEDGFASIYLNARLSHEKQQKALRHELRHINGDDAYNATDIKVAEHCADGTPAAHKPRIIRASELPSMPQKSMPTNAVLWDMETLKRLGILTNSWWNDPLLNLPDYDF